MCVPSDKPLKVKAEGGEVMLDGPDGLVASLTPDAAAISSDRLLEAAGEAQGQRMAAEARRSER